MSKVNLGEVSKELYDLLAGLDEDDRARVVTSVMALFGDAPINFNNTAGSNSGAGGYDEQVSNHNGSAKDFFSQKAPENRGEALAVAARFLELNEDREIVSNEDLHQVFKDARRNFDSKNFSRDMRNAVHNGKFFLSGGERNTYKLSFYGQEYVDALPEKEKAKAIKKPGKAKKVSRKKSKGKSK